MATTKINPNQTNNLVASSDITSIVKITQADYDLLPTKDPNTLYLIEPAS